MPGVKMAPKVSALVHYPIKSAAGIDVRMMMFDAHGPLWDRRFMIVTPDGNKITQREIPELARLIAEPIGDGVRIKNPVVGRMVEVMATNPDDQQTMEVNIWGDHVPALVMDASTNQQLSTELGRKVRLVRMPLDFPRLSRGTRQTDIEPVRMGYADGYPILIVSEASLADLNGRLVAKRIPTVHWSRFRPNIVLSGCDPFEEDTWAGKTIRIGNMEVRVTIPCERCGVINVDQELGERQREPLATLARYRTFPRIDGKKGKKVRFGVNAEHLYTEGRISLGDEVIILD